MRTVCGALAVLLVFALIGVFDARRGESAWQDSALVAQEARAVWQGHYDEAVSRVEKDTVRVTRWATRYDTLRLAVEPILSATGPDTGSVPIGIVQEIITAADSAIQACTDLVTSCSLFRVAADSTVSALERERDALKKLYDAVRPTWRQRFGISCGYSVVKVGSSVQAGPSCGATVRVFP